MRHLIKIALVLLASVAAYYVYGFTSMVADQWIAYGAAGSLVGTYVGLAFAEIPARQSKRAALVAQGAMAIEAIYGTLYVLQVQSPELFVRPLPIWASIALAVLHGGAFSVLAFFVSMFVVNAGNDAPHMPAPEQAMLALCRDMLEEMRGRDHMMPTYIQPYAPALPQDVPAQQEQKTFPCPQCEASLTGPEYGAAQRWGGCRQCRNGKHA